MLSQIPEEIYIEIKAQAKNKRKNAIAFMHQLDSQKINCRKCVGTCCTFEANSMQITPLETIELIQFLIESKVDPIIIFEKMEMCIKEYRSEATYSRPILRKNYTCPFFDIVTKKCQVSRHAKPLGCLAFNPIESNIQNGGTCTSKVDILHKTDLEFSQYDEKMNNIIKQIFKIYWTKAPIPIAIKEIWSKST